MDTTITERLCLFHKLREFSVVNVATDAYIPPHDNKRQALELPHSGDGKKQNTHPEGIFINAGDFNQDMPYVRSPQVLSKCQMHEVRTP